jgi:hypothetical protein
MAADFVAQSNDPCAIPTLLNLLDDPDQDEFVINVSRNGLKKLWRPSPTELTELSQSRSYQIRRLASERLAEIADLTDIP